MKNIMAVVVGAVAFSVVVAVLSVLAEENLFRKAYVVLVENEPSTSWISYDTPMGAYEILSEELKDKYPVTEDQLTEGKQIALTSDGLTPAKPVIKWYYEVKWSYTGQ